MKIMIVIASLLVFCINVSAGDFSLTFYPANYLEVTINKRGLFKYQILSGGSIQRDYNNNISSFGNIKISRDHSGNVDKVGDVRFSYDYNGKVMKIGDYYIQYDYTGKLSKVGDVFIQYDYNGRVDKAGDCRIYYDHNGNVDKFSGVIGDGMNLSVY